MIFSQQIFSNQIQLQSWFEKQISSNQEVKQYIVQSNKNKDINFEIAEKIINYLNNDKQKQQLYQNICHSINICIKLIDQCVQQNYSFKIGLPFNGGKESLIVYIISLTSLLKYSQDNKLQPSNLYQKIFYIFFIFNEQQYDEVIKYIDYCQKYYNFTLNIYNNQSFQKCLFFINTKINMKYCFLGIRNTDNKCNNEIEYKSTNGYPNIIRVNPIFYYRQIDIYSILLKFDIQYCNLYDQGFTSIGGKLFSKQNQTLQCKNKQEINLLIQQLKNKNTSQISNTLLYQLLQNGVQISQIINHFNIDSGYYPSFMIDFNDENDRQGRKI